MKPCPFGCPSVPHILGDESPVVFFSPVMLDGKKVGVSAVVVCLHCGAEGPKSESRKEAKTAWDKRGGLDTILD